MGIKDSKPAFLSYEEALKRVQTNELERIKSTFKRLSGNCNLMSKNSFVNDVIGDTIPQKLAERFYFTCGGTNRGISVKDLIRGLVLITTGSLEEKEKFVFAMVSSDGNFISMEDFENFGTACGEPFSPCDLQGLFPMGIVMTPERFSRWLRGNPNSLTVMKWLLQGQGSNVALRLSSLDSTPSFYQSLAHVTNLTVEDVSALEKQYWLLKSFSKTGLFDLDTFKLHLSNHISLELCEGLFRAFDSNADGNIDFKEMVCGTSSACRSTTPDKLTFCFKVFDADRDGVLSRSEVTNMIQCLIALYAECEETAQAIVNSEALVGEIRQHGKNDELTLNEFLPWASTNRHIHEITVVFSQICHIVFGLKPATAEEEGFVVRKWLLTDERKGLQPGRLYYIIAMSWWVTWQEYVSYKHGKQQHTVGLSSHNSWVNDDRDLKTGPINCIPNDAVPLRNGKMRRSHSSVVPLVVTDPKVAEDGKLDAGQGTCPGPIDNSILLAPSDTRKIANLTSDGGKLKQTTILVRGRDFEVLPEPIWRAMASWYGTNAALPRTVIIPSMQDPEPILELYPVEIQIYRHTTPSGKTALANFGMTNFPSFSFGNSQSTKSSHENGLPQTPTVMQKRTLMYRASFSRKSTVKQVLEFLSYRLKIKYEDMRLWDMSIEHQPVLVEEEDKTLEDVGIRSDHAVLIEVRNSDLSWPEEMNSLVASKNFRERSYTGPLEKGTSGLHNLGNTCFMNSAIQCLSNTQPLTMYFNSQSYLCELNRGNPHGLKGVLAMRYGQLVQDLWSGLFRSIAPVKLRWTIGKYAPQFMGFQQHDSQELLSFLLDGLHEDLNRVHNKPYIELKDSDGRPDEEVANEAWENHLKRNQSIVVDLFQGQLKSQVRCLACNNSSVRFDPYTFLSLPLPMENSLHVEVIVFSFIGSTPMKYGLLLESDCKFLTLRQKLSSVSKIRLENLVIAELFGASVQSFPPDSSKLRNALAGRLVAYEVLFQSVAECAESEEISRGVCCKTLHPNYGYGLNGNKSNSEGNSSASSVTSCGKQKDLTRKKESEGDRATEIEQRQKELEVQRLNMCQQTCKSNFVGNARQTGQATVPENANTGYVIVMHRKMVQSDMYFLAWQKFQPHLFGIPLIIALPKGMLNRDLYSTVWNQVSRLVSAEKEKDAKFKYPFELKSVNKDGRFCGICPWYRFCRGCIIPCNISLCNDQTVYIAADWDPTTLHLTYQPAQEQVSIDDASVNESQTLLREPFDLDQCLQDFTKDEELGEEETWYCPKCKQHQSIVKKFDLWSLPPILVIHLKRFQLRNNRWIKSNKLATFPVTGFDPSKYLVKKRLDSRIFCRKESQRENSISPLSSEDSYGGANRNSSETNDLLLDLDSDDLLPNTETNIASGTYNLFALSCHIGMLNGGHYISYARNPNGKWYCYNDSTCKEVDPDTIKNESPYMLFYQRDGINLYNYLPDTGDKKPDLGLDDSREFETDVKKYCVIQ